MRLDKPIVQPMTDDIVNIVITVRNDDKSFAGRVESLSINNEAGIMLTKQQLRMKAKMLYEERNQ